jgi:two-component system, NarL family, nitrate/nitrite sensor histidine kinase NarX
VSGDAESRATDMHTVLPTWQRLSSKIVGVLLGFLLIALVAVGATLLLSWQLEGSSAAINETGSLRMQSYRLTLQLNEFVTDPVDARERARVERSLEGIEETFERLRRGDPQRPLILPPTSRIGAGFDVIVARWENVMRPLAEAVLLEPGEQRTDAWRSFRNEADPFVGEINNLVHMIERDSELRTFWLRSSQLALVALALGGTVAIIYLMFMLIVEPVARLRGGIERMADKDFSVRLPVENQDEFGQLTRGFNQMADRLQELYGSLEERVRAKTAALADQNRELALLYDSATFLQRPQELEILCAGFLDRITAFFGADGGSVRVLDDRRGNMHMVVHRGLSPELIEFEKCMKIGECLCGEAVVRKVSIVRDLRSQAIDQEMHCKREGFVTVSVFHIHVHEQHIGFFNMHFRHAKAFSDKERALLETLGQLLGIAIENRRLATREREMAISEERNLVAQGLHDSIAQGLTFLNLQVQMLDDSVREGKLSEAALIVPALRSGVQESYEDVRELLLNFRSRLAEDDLIGALTATVDKFRAQTGIEAEFIADGNGPPFSRDQQLQLLFIVQEALSNIRKHAMARHVTVRLEDNRNFALNIEDDGVGFDAQVLLEKGDSHVGLNIMRERAQRIHASLNVSSSAGKGTKVVVELPYELRRAA